MGRVPALEDGEVDHFSSLVQFVEYVLAQYGNGG